MDGSLVDDGLGRDGEAADEGRVVGDVGECVVEGAMSCGLGTGVALATLSGMVWAE